MDNWDTANSGEQYSSYEKLIREWEGKKEASPARIAVKEVFTNGWFYAALIWVWGFYVNFCSMFLLPYMYIPLILAVCFFPFWLAETVSVRKRIKQGKYEAKKRRRITKKMFIEGLGQTLGSKWTYIIMALMATPPYWIADYYFGGLACEMPVKACVILVSFAAVIAYLAHKKAGKL